MRSLVLIAALAGFAGSGCRHYVYAPHPPAVTWRWWYYPDSYCYYHPVHHYYYYRTPSGAWVRASSPPPSVSLSGHVELDDSSAEPWHSHHVHVNIHPARIVAPHVVLKNVPKPHEVIKKVADLPRPPMPHEIIKKALKKK
ncbi:MAG: hypothetical protein L0216_20940 [Planctomycetales bacterium]|nr:hypothetical protein [Planctomycetales bacterium]